MESFQHRLSAAVPISGTCPNCLSTQVHRLPERNVKTGHRYPERGVHAEYIQCGGCGSLLHSEDVDPNSERFAFLKLEHQRQREAQP